MERLEKFRRSFVSQRPPWRRPGFKGKGAKGGKTFSKGGKGFKGGGRGRPFFFQTTHAQDKPQG